MYALRHTAMTTTAAHSRCAVRIIVCCLVVHNYPIKLVDLNKATKLITLYYLFGTVNFFLQMTVCILFGAFEAMSAAV